MLELLALGSDHGAAIEVATRFGGQAYLSHPDEGDRRPFSSLLRISTDNVEAVHDVADVALYVAYCRYIKTLDSQSRTERVVASFPLNRHPDLTHRESDDHWRDVHAPLALRSHSAMCDYVQLSIVATLSGQELDGIALCAFASREELRHRFFNDDRAKAAIEADVSRFADVNRSPRRVVLTQEV